MSRFGFSICNIKIKISQQRVAMLSLFILACSPALSMEPVTAQTPLSVLANPRILPRNINLNVFDPHRKGFVCTHQASRLPPTSPEAEALLQQALAASSRDLWPDDRDYPKTVRLWEEAMRLGSWKAQINLASLLLNGAGEGQYTVPPDEVRAIILIEEGMRKGWPPAFDMMGGLYSQGLLRSKDGGERAWAFWQLAADMGNPNAQAYIAEKIAYPKDNPNAGVWGNMQVGVAMFECAIAQEYGPAARDYGATLESIAKYDVTGDQRRETYRKALEVWHQGVKWGSYESAAYLSVEFRNGSPVAGNLIDAARAKRYSTLSDMLYRNRDLRFPNLDKILPLPPADLPVWDGNRKTLRAAAQGVLAVPPTLKPAKPRKSSPSSSLTPPHLSAIDLDAARMGDPYVLRLATAQALIHNGVATASPPPPQRIVCHAGDACPQSGVWAAWVDDLTPSLAAKAFNHWSRQAYFEAGHVLPHPQPLDHTPADLQVPTADVLWTWLGNANEVRIDEQTWITVPQFDDDDDEA